VSSTAAQPLDRRFFVLNALVSASALTFLAWLLVVHDARPSGGGLAFLAPVIASCNAIAAAFLFLGRAAIKRKNVALHRLSMIAGFAASALFLACYVAYHATVGHQVFRGTGPVKGFYLAILASHVLLSVAVVPGSLTAFWYAFRKNFERHRRLVRWLWPVWMYVSVTGVLVYVLRVAAG